MAEYPIVFIINGYPESGKDTFVDIVTNIGIYFDKHDKYTGALKEGFLTINSSTVDIIKHVAKILGWDGVKTPEARKFLSDLKDLSTNFNDYPNQKIINDVKACRESQIAVNKATGDYYYHEKVDNVLVNNAFKFWFIHCREPEHIEKLKNAIGNDCYTIFMVRDVHIKEASNHADANVENYKYDFYIDNTGTLEDLEAKAFKFLKRFDT